jgi:hypothetical protein
MKFEKEWQEETATISRLELGNIIAEEIVAVGEAMKAADFDPQLQGLFHELLLRFSTSIAAEIFNGER